MLIDRAADFIFGASGNTIKELLREKKTDVHEIDWDHTPGLYTRSIAI